MLREYQQKTFITLSRFWSLRGWGGGGALSETFKIKKEFVTKIFFSDNAV